MKKIITSLLNFKLNVLQEFGFKGLQPVKQPVIQAMPSQWIVRNGKQQQF